MAYLGTAPAEAYSPTAVKDSFNGDGSTVAFTMSQPSKTNDVRVVVENVVQDPAVAYTCSGTTITFTSAPPVGTANVYVVHLGLPVQSIVPPDEINIATTYTTDLTVQGAFTSQGIDDNADATAITINSSENVGINSTNPQTKFVVRASDSENIEISGSWIQSFNRSGSPGYASLPFYASSYTFNNGPVLKPSQPAFFAQLRNASTSTTGTIVWNYVHVNIGGHYNSSTGVFTAPVAGKYVFSVNATSDTGTTSGPWIRIYKNGAFDQYGSAYTNDGEPEGRISNTIIYDLSANDTVSVNVDTTRRGIRGNPDYHNNFSGYLLC
jgi:hypothetical protein